MKRLINIAVFIFLSQMCTGQVMMLFSQDSLTGIVSPLDVDSLFYWFAADVGVTDSLGGAIATDEGVGTWNDLSGNGHHVTQSTNGARPVWKATGGPGSKPCIQFDGTDDFLASAAHLWESDDLTVFVVMKFANATRNAFEDFLTRRGTSDTRQWTLGYGDNGAPAYGLNVNIFKEGTTPLGRISIRSTTQVKSTAWKLKVFWNNGVSNFDMWTDGSAATLTETVVGTGDYSIFDANDKLAIGCSNPNSTPVSFTQGSFSEIIVFSRALTATERTAIENYLNRKYDLY